MTKQLISKDINKLRILIMQALAFLFWSQIVLVRTKILEIYTSSNVSWVDFNHANCCVGFKDS